MRWATSKLVNRDLQTQTVRSTFPLGPHVFLNLLSVYPSFNRCSRSKLCMVFIAFSHRPWHMANLPPPSFLQTEIPYRLNGLIQSARRVEFLATGFISCIRCLNAMGSIF